MDLVLFVCVDLCGTTQQVARAMQESAMDMSRDARNVRECGKEPAPPSPENASLVSSRDLYIAL